MQTETVHQSHQHHQQQTAIDGDFSSVAFISYKGRKYWPPVLLLPAGNEVTIAEFDKCILDHFKEAGDRMYAEVSLCEQGLILSTVNSDEPSNKHKKYTNVPIEHSVYCPIRALSSRTDIHQSLVPPYPPVKVGVAVLIENIRTNTVLLTRRSPTMRTFPCVWVIPGGHMEIGESFEQTAIREVHEETGITLSKGDIQVFLLYESVSPVLISTGPPTDHHIVVYMRATVNIAGEDIVLQPAEVDAAAWLTKDTVERSLLPLSSTETATHEDVNIFDAFEVQGATKKLAKYHISKLQSYLELGSNEIALERLSTGTRYVLREWLLSVNNKRAML